MTKARIILRNKMVFTGQAPFAFRARSGEAVFTTGMTGYVETLTDPSYAGQIIVFTFPLVGNYGVPAKRFWESEKIQAAGAIMGETCGRGSHRDRNVELSDWFRRQKTPLIVGVDTRALTIALRRHGTLAGRMECRGASACGHQPPWSVAAPVGHICERVSIKRPLTYHGSGKLVIAVDCGIKNSLLGQLRALGATVKRVPYDYDYSGEKFDGIFISNGPGDPAAYRETALILSAAMKRKKPTFGVCLGAQLLAMAAGAKTYRLPFGHRGQNQPCRETATKRCFITSQNHGYAVDAATLPDDWRVSFVNLNDGTVEGVAHKTLPYFAAQFHPEGTPGPADTLWLFKKFHDLL